MRSNQINGAQMLENLSSAMRAEEVGRAQASDLWTMAALITANGGASAALLDQVGSSIAAAIAISLYMVGVAAALVAGRLSANLAHEGSALFVSLVHMNFAVRARAEAPEDVPELVECAEQSLQETKEPRGGESLL